MRISWFKTNFFSVYIGEIGHKLNISFSKQTWILIIIVLVSSQSLPYYISRRDSLKSIQSTFFLKNDIDGDRFTSRERLWIIVSSCLWLQINRGACCTLILMSADPVVLMCANITTVIKIRASTAAKINHRGEVYHDARARITDNLSIQIIPGKCRACGIAC